MEFYTGSSVRTLLSHPAECHPIFGNDGILYYTRHLNCISNLHTDIFGLIPLCPCDNCCIVYYGPTASLLGLK